MRGRQIYLYHLREDSFGRSQIHLRKRITRKPEDYPVSHSLELQSHLTPFSDTPAVQLSSVSRHRTKLAFLLTANLLMSPRSVRPRAHCQTKKTRRIQLRSHPRLPFASIVRNVHDKLPRRGAHRRAHTPGNVRTESCGKHLKDADIDVPI